MRYKSELVIASLQKLQTDQLEAKKAGVVAGAAGDPEWAARAVGFGGGT
jgi:hypothetical protein